MEGFINYFTAGKERLLVPLSIALATTVVLIVVRGMLLRFLMGITKKTDRFDHGLIALLKTPSFFWVIATGLYTAVAASDLPQRYSRPINQTIYVLLAVSITIVAANISATLFKNFVRAPDGSQIRSGLAVGIVRGTVSALGILIILSILGIPITPVLTALGVGGLAVALALKDTLENLFAGIYLITDRTIRVGDIVKIESGHDGVVDDIGWRTTRIRTFNNTTVIIPNIKLAQSVVTNYCLPNPRFGTSFTFLVGQRNDPNQVETVVMEVLKKGTEDIVGLVSHPDPTIRFIPGIVPGGLEFTVGYQVENYTDLGFIQHELKKRILKSFRDNSVSLPELPSVISYTSS